MMIYEEIEMETATASPPKRPERARQLLGGPGASPRSASAAPARRPPSPGGGRAAFALGGRRAGVPVRVAATRAPGAPRPRAAARSQPAGRGETRRDGADPPPSPRRGTGGVRWSAAPLNVRVVGGEVAPPRSSSCCRARAGSCMRTGARAAPPPLPAPSPGRDPPPRAVPAGARCSPAPAAIG